MCHYVKFRLFYESSEFKKETIVILSGFLFEFFLGISCSDESIDGASLLLCDNCKMAARSLVY